MSQETYYILAINPGSTSTKIAIYENKTPIHEKQFDYDNEMLAKYADIPDQKDFRLKDILDYLESINFPVEKLSGVVGRGGVLVPIKVGAYVVNELMLDRLNNRPLGPHASNLGGVLAYEIARKAGVDAYVYDGVTVDEMPPVARITGYKAIERFSRCHALNMRATAMKCAEKLGKTYKDLNIIVAHMGGGITLSVHEKGRMVDMVLDTEGPLSTERCGRMPATQLLNYNKDMGFTHREALRMIRGKGGMVDLLGTNNALEVEKRAAAGDEWAALVQDAMCYQTAKAIGELATVVCGKVDVIVLTGAIARSKDAVVPAITKRVDWIAPVEVFPGENEMESLAFGALRVLTGQEQAHVYDQETDDQDKDKVLY